MNWKVVRLKIMKQSLGTERSGTNMNPLGSEFALFKLETWVTFAYGTIRDIDYYFYFL